MIGWIKDRIRGAANTVEGVLSALHDVATALWAALTVLQQGIRHRFEHMYNTARVAALRAADLALTLLHTALWIADSLLPRYVKARVTELIRWASHLVDVTAAALRFALAQLWNAAVARIVAVARQLEAWAAAFGRAVVALGVRMLAVERLVFSLLTNPARLAAWLLPGLLRPLLRFLESQAEAAARWLFPRLLRVALSQLPLIERIIADLF